MLCYFDFTFSHIYSKIVLYYTALLRIDHFIVSAHTLTHTHIQEDEKEQNKRLAAVEKERKDLEKEELKRKRGSEREAKERIRQEEILSKENKKLMLKCTKDKRKSESIDRNKVRAVYRKDFSSELKRVRSDAVATVLQCFDAEETVQEQAEHTRYFLNGSSDPDIDTDTEESDRKAKLAALFLTIPSCDKAFLRSIESPSPLKNGSDASHGPGSLEGTHTALTDTHDSTVRAYKGTAESVIWDDVFQASTCLSVFSERLQLQVPLTLEGLVKRIAHISLAGEVNSSSARNHDPRSSSSSSAALNSLVAEDLIKSEQSVKTAHEEEQHALQGSDAVHTMNGTSHSHSDSNFDLNSNSRWQAGGIVVSADDPVKHEEGDKHLASSSVKIEADSVAGTETEAGAKDLLMVTQEMAIVEEEKEAVEEVKQENIAEAAIDESSVVETVKEEAMEQAMVMDVVDNSAHEVVVHGEGIVKVEGERREEGEGKSEKEGSSSGDKVTSTLLDTAPVTPPLAVTDTALSSVDPALVLEGLSSAEVEAHDGVDVKVEVKAESGSDLAVLPAEVINVNVVLLPFSFQLLPMLLEELASRVALYFIHFSIPPFICLSTYLSKYLSPYLLISSVSQHSYVRSSSTTTCPPF